MRAFERQEGESARAYRAFATYRDLGSDRTLKAACEIYYGSTSNLRQVQEWSRRHDWVARARAFDDWREMMIQSAIEERTRAQAQHHAEREARLREKALEIREAAASQALAMVKWPLTAQRTLKEGPDGDQVVYVFEPAGWNKATARTFFDLAMGSAPQPEDIEDEAELDLSALSDEDLRTYLEITSKLTVRRREHGE